MKTVTVPFFISHQGCPHNCVFCDQRTISGSSGSLPSTDEIVSKIGRWQATSAGRQLEVAFFGGSFTALPMDSQERLLTPLQPLLADGDIAAVRLSTRPDFVDDERVGWLKSQGVSTIELGVQSMEDGVLAASGRGHDAACSAAAMACIKRHGLRAGAQLMPGLPEDTPLYSLQSLERVMAAGADFVRIYPTVVIAGTELAGRYAAGNYKPWGLERGIALCKLLLQRAMQADLPVIRIGLQADDGLNRDTVLAGCWHPALGQLVRSGLYLDLFKACVSPGESITVFCHPARFSDVIGQNKSNLKQLSENNIIMQLMPDVRLAKEEVVINNRTGSCKYNLLTDLKYAVEEV